MLLMEFYKNHQGKTLKIMLKCQNQYHQIQVMREELQAFHNQEAKIRAKTKVKARAQVLKLI